MKILIMGFKSSGKTTFGKTLSEYLSLPFHDSDDEIMKIFQGYKSVREVFQTVGESEFRKLEHEVIKTFTNKSVGVFALGGGSLDLDLNRNFLKSFSQRLFLDTELEVIKKRLGEQKDYPYSSNLLEKYTFRKSIFLNCCNMILEIEKQSPLQLLKQWKMKNKNQGADHAF